MRTTDYTVLFDFRYNWGWHWLIGLLTLVFVCIGLRSAILSIRQPDAYPVDDRIRYICVAVVSALIFTIFVASQIYDQLHERSAFASGDYDTVEGPVRNYTVNDSGKTEWFDVGGVRFEVSCCWASMRFHHTPVEGGEQIIRDGEWLRITYLSPEEILRIEKRN